jgi:Flp pilus assembly protein TadD
MTRPLATLLALMLAAASAANAGPADEVRARMARGDLDGALQQIETAVGQRPNDAQLRFLRGVVLMDLGRDAQALQVFEEMSQAYPELPEPLNNIGLLRARGGKLELARQALQDALRTDPSHRAARANLAQVHLMLAVQGWQQLAASAPADLGLQRRLEVARGLLALPAR